jgi:hypothetical protein
MNAHGPLRHFYLARRACAASRQPVAAMDPMKYPAETGGARRLALPAHGFGEFEVPEMPGYVQSYSKRGNSIDADQTPVYQQARLE